MLRPKDVRRGGALRDIKKTAARESLYVNENRNKGL